MAVLSETSLESVLEIVEATEAVELRLMNLASVLEMESVMVLNEASEISLARAVEMVDATVAVEAR